MTWLGDDGDQGKGVREQWFNGVWGLSRSKVQSIGRVVNVVLKCKARTLTMMA